MEGLPEELCEQVAAAEPEAAPAPVAPVKASPNKTKFGPSLPGNYPDEMRRQLWPLCCGASIISGFKNVGSIPDEDLLNQINHTINKMIPDMQVYHYEKMMPTLTFLTLNQGQMASKKIMTAIEKAGFIKIGQANPRSANQGFFVKDTSGTWKTENAIAS
jgi:hypothetical protein